MIQFTDDEHDKIVKFFMNHCSSYAGVCDVVMVHDKNLFNTTKNWQSYFNPLGKSRLNFLPSQACHGFMGTYLNNDSVVAVLTSVRSNRQKNSLAKEWCEFITGPNSPWRSLPKFEEAHVYMHGEKPLYIYVPVEPDTPAQLLVNFLIATRSVYEKYDMKLKVWADMRDRGLTDVEAMFFSWHLSATDDGPPFSVVKDREYNVHSFLNTWSVPVDFKRLLESNPILIASHNKWKERANYRPCNSIWNKLDMKFYPLLLEMDGNKKYEGCFPKFFKNKHSGRLFFENGMLPPYDRIVSMILERKGELYSDQGQA